MLKRLDIGHLQARQSRFPPLFVARMASKRARPEAAEASLEEILAEGRISDRSSDISSDDEEKEEEEEEEEKEDKSPTPRPARAPAVEDGIESQISRKRKKKTTVKIDGNVERKTKTSHREKIKQRRTSSGRAPANINTPSYAKEETEKRFIQEKLPSPTLSCTSTQSPLPPLDFFPIPNSSSLVSILFISLSLTDRELVCIACGTSLDYTRLDVVKHHLLGPRHLAKVATMKKEGVQQSSIAEVLAKKKTDPVAPLPQLSPDERAWRIMVFRRCLLSGIPISQIGSISDLLRPRGNNFSMSQETVIRQDLVLATMELEIDEVIKLIRTLQYVFTTFVSFVSLADFDSECSRSLSTAHPMLVSSSPS